MIAQSNAPQNRSRWSSLYRAGGIAPFITLAFYLVQVLTIAFAAEPFPTSPAGWFVLLQRSRIVGLLYLNALDIFSITVLGLMYLALVVALRQANRSYTTIAAFFAFTGIPVFVAPRVAMLSVVRLSDRYAAATSEAQRTLLLAAGETLDVLGVATPQTVGFFFLAVAGFILSLVIVRSSVFSKVAGYLGLLAGAVTALNGLSTVLSPSFASLVMPVNGLLWLVWWILIGLGLFKLARECA